MQYILIHGAWQGAWAWKFLAKELENLGHTVSCFDLPGHGKSSFPLSKVTYNVYYQALEDEIKKYDKVTLVAHSMSGIVACPLFDKHRDRIHHLFLIAAIIAQNGESLLDVVVRGGPSEIPSLLITDEENNTQSLDKARVKNALYHDCPNEIADWAIPQLQPSPVEPFFKKIDWQDSGETKHKRTYILCQEDRDVHPETQSNIIENYPCCVVKFASGHFPFLSKPKELAEILTLRTNSCF